MEEAVALEHSENLNRLINYLRFKNKKMFEPQNTR